MLFVYNMFVVGLSIYMSTKYSLWWLLLLLLLSHVEE